MRLNRFWIFALIQVLSAACAFAQQGDACPRGAVGSAVPEPRDLRSKDGVLRAELAYRTLVDAHGQTLYCYISPDGSESPNLRVKPGDQLILSLKNEVPAAPAQDSSAQPHAMPAHGNQEACASGPMATEMTAASTNLHFHGLLIPPLCHQDDTLNTLIAPAAAPFEYKFQIPLDQPPGLYWYHPHVHGFTKAQVLGGASGALIVEGIEQQNPAVSGLPEHVFVIRDQNLVNPDAAPVPSGSMPPPQVLRDAEGDILNSGTGGGKPAKDLSINFVPVPFPDYQPAVITMKPSERQLWRVLNASAITYLDLQVLINDRPQRLGLVALDGIPINDNGNRDQQIDWKFHIFLPPAGRAEFIVKGPAEGVRASLVTRTVDTGPAGENDPTRPLAIITARAGAPEPQSQLPVAAATAPSTAIPLSKIAPAHQRKLYFSEIAQNPNDPNSPTVFMLTVEGQPPVPFDPHAGPSLIVKQGDVEDWIVENRTQELHDFHIHQLHFQLLEWNGVPVDEPYLRDTVNVAYWDGKSPVYPQVKLRINFRNPNVTGTFVYHCHLLEHSDGGMMGTIRVEPSLQKTAALKRHNLASTSPALSSHVR